MAVKESGVVERKGVLVGLRVVLVERVPRSRMALAVALRDAGAAVVMVEGAALRRLRRADVVIVDAVGEVGSDLVARADALPAQLKVVLLPIGAPPSPAKSARPPLDLVEPLDPPRVVTEIAARLGRA